MRRVICRRQPPYRKGFVMGDKGGKKDKEKSQKQKAASKQAQSAKSKGKGPK